jgi:hypothetical protein
VLYTRNWSRAISQPADFNPATIARPLLNNLSSKGNYSNLLVRLKGVNNKGINKRDVYFNVFNTFNSFNVLKF